MGTYVGVFQVAEAPKYGHVYSIPKKMLLSVGKSVLHFWIRHKKVSMETKTSAIFKNNFLNTPTSKVSREIARKNMHIHVYGVKELVCLKDSFGDFFMVT